MKSLKIALVLLTVFCVSMPAFAKEGSADKGKKLFNDAKFASGEKSCNSCHTDGRGLKNAGTKTKFNIMGGVQNSLEEAVNTCIVNANKGKAIDEGSQEMKDIVAYIKSLGMSQKPQTSGY